MSVDQVTTFFSLLALVAAAISVATGISLATTSGRSVLASMGGSPLRLATAVAATSVAGSLYFSEVAGFRPCELCWYQRIAMYPLAIILLVAIARPGGDVARFALPLSISGAAVSIYHYQLQLFPDQGAVCEPGASCAFRWVHRFGFISIPLMAMAGFTAVTALMVADKRQMATKHRETTR
ncbi:MAG: disulfide bond formation protein B [Acidimicrobiales bacterium]|jgi:disulfide bond formation protein DsbB|nr:disulfide bond formation protein B [Acidimicrobiales bacterium]HJO80659.1 disulfide bond formation protein B [Acidimicrobiales bacterium]|tara:strand:+ start:684 stop:1226 length:543 start_codon:yes stop_codon:yes gene_type:complete